MSKRNTLKRGKAPFKALTPLEAVHESAAGLYDAGVIFISYNISETPPGAFFICDISKFDIDCG